MEIREELDKLVAELKTQRDELQLKVGLAKAEVRDEWNALEKKLDHVRGRLEVVGKEAGEVTDEVKTALQLAADELKKGYAKIRNLL